VVVCCFVFVDGLFSLLFRRCRCLESASDADKTARPNIFLFPRLFIVPLCFDSMDVASVSSPGSPFFSSGEVFQFPSYLKFSLLVVSLELLKALPLP